LVSETSSTVEPSDRREATRLRPDDPGTQAESFVNRRFRLIAPLAVMLVAAAIYGPVYFREDSMPTGVGANLVPAERVLNGEVPYRDFYKIQTPGILLLNAALFKLFGTSLLTALQGVLVFKILTIVLVFLVARLFVSQWFALLPPALSLLWLPPGGPFSPAPIQYEMPLILTATYFTLRWVNSRRPILLFAAGVAVGFIALFKQNVGVYSAIALELSILTAGWTSVEAPPGKTRRLFQSHLSAGTGIALPLLGLLIYLVANSALGAAIRVFVKGPGEHIQMKLTGYPLPWRFALVLIVGAIAVSVVAAIGKRVPRSRLALALTALAGAVICAVVAPQSFVDNSIFWFSPAVFFCAAWTYVRGQRHGYESALRQRAMLVVLLMFSIASYLEVFPRSVRGLVIGTLPPAFILLTVLFARRYGMSLASEAERPRADHSFPSVRLFQLAVISVVAFVFGARIIVPNYFEFEAGRIRLKADTELGFSRGRGVYMPSARALEVNQTVELIQTRVEAGGYFFAHAIEATPYYFLAERNSPTGATLWNDAGTDDAERARILQLLREKDVRLVLTSNRALEAERYDPLLMFLKNAFRESGTIGRLVLLERNY